MDSLRNQTLVNKQVQMVQADSALHNAQIICYYFSAHWCPPCRMFTPILADFYTDLKDNGAPIEVVFVSSDRSDSDMKAYLNESHGDWLAVPWGSPLASHLKSKYGISGIPALVVVKSNDGTIITRDGRSDVHRKGTSAFSEWASK